MLFSLFPSKYLIYIFYKDLWDPNIFAFKCQIIHLKFPLNEHFIPVMQTEISKNSEIILILYIKELGAVMTEQMISNPRPPPFTMRRCGSGWGWGTVEQW